MSRAKPGWTPLQRAVLVPRSPEQRKALFDSIKRMKVEGVTDEDINRTLDFAQDELREVWKNHLYQVHVIRHEGGPDDCGIIQLSIKRLDRTPQRDWRDFQRIKNQLVGPEYEAVELYPAESRLVDTANQYHLWLVNSPTFRWPIGYESGRVTSNESAGGAVQRPLED